MVWTIWIVKAEAVRRKSWPISRTLGEQNFGPFYCQKADVSPSAQAGVAIRPQRPNAAGQCQTVPRPRRAHAVEHLRSPQRVLAANIPCAVGRSAGHSSSSRFVKLATIPGLRPPLRDEAINRTR